MDAEILSQVKGENNDVMVKRLPKKAAPKRFGRSLTAKQKELATHICVDCGWIYAERCAVFVHCILTLMHKYSVCGVMQLACHPCSPSGHMRTL